jgi:hypothetical protein
MCDQRQQYLDALKVYFDNNLKAEKNMSYMSKDTPHTEHPGEGYELLYQDATACSASHALSDIFKHKYGYLVRTDVGCASFTGEDPSTNSKYHDKMCNDLDDVLHHLLEFCFHDPNTTGEMVHDILYNVCRIEIKIDSYSILKEIREKKDLFDRIKDSAELEKVVRHINNKDYKYTSLLNY